MAMALLLALLSALSFSPLQCHQSNNSPRTTLANFGAHNFSFPEQRFLLYDVNPGEGFNLRRDVYMRVANAVRQLRERGHDFVLVLPPWGGIWHWRRRAGAANIAWDELFDLDSLGSFVPVIEFEEFLARNGDSIDLVLYLQHYAEGWSQAEGFAIKYDIQSCLDGRKHYRRVDDSKWKGPFFGHDQMRSSAFECVSFQGQSSTLVEAILELGPPNWRALMVDRAETILHDHFGDGHYWRARKSMRYAQRLRRIGDEFRRERFNSSEQDDGPGSEQAGGRRTARGGDYFCAHLRRADFVWAHKGEVPSIEGAAEQLAKLSVSLGLDHLFLCTDSSAEEVADLTAKLTGHGIRVERFGTDRDELTEAAISIIDQWICANARWFIGTHQSTFSFRIHEDREILGFQPDSTFNRFCADGQVECEQPAKWTIPQQEE